MLPFLLTLSPKIHTSRIFGNKLVMLWRVKPAWRKADLDDAKRQDSFDAECLDQAALQPEPWTSQFLQPLISLLAKLILSQLF